ncbi:hypothetical protein SCLARK_00943 [Spiroplasma clarkii]|uniref:Lipoprotein n=1 Tax=Spiroplasma clarkii TaxID=2139 RepID=A0A1Y0L0P2_9MOLU|nr:lipoprotein [Spiroplasma clarkii]ARU91551.1 hypothetical protein SCLARK_00943 [Spiroplasma clarkii]ATX70953.1 hypothetical protein SCLAR_v1c06340 [Spiroplasma clarkii]
MKKLLGLLAATGLVASTGSAVIACGENTDSAITTEAIKTAVKGFLENGKSDYTTTELKALLDKEESAIPGVANWTITAKSGTASTAVFEFAVVEGYVLDDNAEKTTGTFEITYLLAVTPVQKTPITTEEIETEVIAKIGATKYANIAALQTALDGFVSDIDGITSLTAAEVEDSLDAIVTFELEETYELDGEVYTFTLEDIIEE